MYDGSSIALVQLVAEYLVWLDEDLRLQPQLAESWTAEDGGKRWTFTLRRGVRFTDGTPMDSSAVKASFDRLLDPASKSAAASAFATILGPGGVSAPDASTVTFTLQRPFTEFAYLVSAGNFNAVILKADYAGDFTRSAIGTGPFTLTSYDPSAGASFARNTGYWQPGKPYLDAVDVHFYADDQADLIALQGDQIDTQFLSVASLVTPLAGSAGIVVDKAIGTGLTAFTLRTDRPPFDRKEVRQALAYGLNRPDVLTSIGSGVGVLGNDHLLAPAFRGAPTGLQQRAQDRAKVAELLAAAGVPTLNFTLTFDPPSRDYAVTIQNQLQQVGITVELDQRTSSDFYGGNQTTDTPWLFTTANLVAWAGRAVPSQLITPMVTSGGVWNGSKYANPALDRAAAAYDAASTDQERAAQAQIIAEALREDVPVIVSYWSGTVRAFNSATFAGIRAHPSSYVDFRSVSRV